MPLPVIVIPGEYVSIDTYRPLVDEVRRHTPAVVVADPQGHPLAANTEAVQAVVDGLPEPPVVLAHSFGGAVAGALRGVAHLVFLGAFILDLDETAASFLERAGEAPGDNAFLAALRPAADGLTATMDPEASLGILFNGLDPDTARLAAAGLGPALLENFTAQPAAARWKATPSLWVGYRDERTWHPSLPPILAGRCTAAVEIPGGHCAFADRPTDVVDHLRPLL